MAVEVKVTYKCDKCGKTKSETLKDSGYAPAVEVLEGDQEIAYVPEGWGWDESKLYCPECFDKEHPLGDNSVAIA